MPACVVSLISVVLLITALFSSFSSPAHAQELPSGSVWHWGDLPDGYTGGCPNPPSNTPTAVAVPDLSDVVQVASGMEHAVALKSEGTVWSWGTNTNGQLGIGTFGMYMPATTPVKVLNLTNVIAVATSAGSEHTLALRADGSVWGWGRADSGQLGIGELVPKYPSMAPFEPSPVQVRGLTGVVAIATRENASVAVTADGWVWGWGYHGARTESWEPREVLTPERIDYLGDVVDLAGAGDHILALKADGTVWVWTPVQDAFQPKSGLSGVRAISSGWRNSFAVTSGGNVWGWGSGYLGNGTDERDNDPAPARVEGLTGVVDVNAGSYHTVALKADGTVWAWGYNGYGEVGTGTCSEPYPTRPVKVAGIDGVKAVATGRFRSFAWSPVQLRTPAPDPPPVPPAPPPTPIVSPAGGTYTSIQIVALFSPGAAMIKYTLDGSDPIAHGLIYRDYAYPTIDRSLTLKAVAIGADGSYSGVMTAVYVINRLPDDRTFPLAPEAQPPGGEYGGAQLVHLFTAPSDATIRYTLDGFTPTATSGSVYSEPITIVSSLTLKAMAMDPDGNISPVMEAVYTIRAPGTTPTPSAGTPPEFDADVSSTLPFAGTWARTDAPVAEGEADRTWMWGPQPLTGMLTEGYAESPDGRRQVQYFDKSRMEITHPDAANDGIWYVTNGLLVLEMVTGQMQVGDSAFVQREPAQVSIAGDPGTGPAYAALDALRSTPARPEGTTITERLNADGSLSNDANLLDRGVMAGHVVDETSHAVAEPFWQFMTSSGIVFEEGRYANDVLFGNPFYATGFPITEAYWVEVTVSGTTKDVLIQCFERRCLTYTPDNPPGWQVEAGNVGQHYYVWRYGALP